MNKSATFPSVVLVLDGLWLNYSAVIFDPLAKTFQPFVRMDKVHNRAKDSLFLFFFLLIKRYTFGIEVNGLSSQMQYL